MSGRAALPLPEVYRIGDGMDDRELLSRVTSLGFDASGNLYISDLSGNELEILVVDTAGEFVTRFERRGGGPGEFRRATEAFALPDGRIVVADGGILAYHIFGPGRIFERRVRYPGVGETYVPSPLRRPGRWTWLWFGRWLRTCYRENCNLAIVGVAILLFHR